MTAASRSNVGPPCSLTFVGRNKSRLRPDTVARSTTGVAIRVGRRLVLRQPLLSISSMLYFFLEGNFFTRFSIRNICGSIGAAASGGRLPLAPKRN